MGKYTSIMISTPNTAGLNTSRVLWVTSIKRSLVVSTRPKRCCAIPSRRKAFSTTMTAPSTIIPKSIAPRLIKLPDTLLATMPLTANSILKGITHAVISAARTFPSRMKSTTITSTAPSNRFFSTVAIVLSTREVRLYTVSITTPSGKLRCTSSILLATFCATMRLFSPISIMAVPNTTSLSPEVEAPVRNCSPSLTSATSLTRTGASSRFVTTTPRISSSVLSCPGERTNHCSPFFSI